MTSVLRCLLYSRLTQSSLHRSPHIYNGTLTRQCSCSARRAYPGAESNRNDTELPTIETNEIHASESPPLRIHKNPPKLIRKLVSSKDSGRPVTPSMDHQTLAHRQKLFITSPYSPGSPLLLPNGADMFIKLSNFLRAQYAQFGFREVITPTIYKRSLWEKSGHWENYKDDMFEVNGRGLSGQTKDGKQIGEDEEFGLKPMNCPGHCLLYAAEKYSYRDLPIRYADFSALHRNEVSGSLSGLTRVRRFHQDDAHIFCRPSQIEEEIRSTMAFVDLVYSKIFNFGPYQLVLSTRPEKDYIGTLEEWDRAESQLKSALDSTNRPWRLNPGDGAFYGPKIDIILRDAHGKEHQTATIQLDFQLPQRFNLSYVAPAPDLEAKGTVVPSYEPLPNEQQGEVRPVMIHRAILGSLERFMALLIEHYHSVYPFWIAPRPCLVMNVQSTPDQIAWSKKVAAMLGGQKHFAGATGQSSIPRPESSTLNDTKWGPSKMASLRPYLNIEVDASSRSVGKKMLEAEQNGHNIIVLIGAQEVAQQSISIKICHSQHNKEAVTKQLMALVQSLASPKQSASASSNGAVPAESDGEDDGSSTLKENEIRLPTGQGEWIHINSLLGHRTSFGMDRNGQYEVRGLKPGVLRRLFKKLQDAYM